MAQRAPSGIVLGLPILSAAAACTGTLNAPEADAEPAGPLDADRGVLDSALSAGPDARAPQDADRADAALLDDALSADAAPPLDVGPVGPSSTRQTARPLGTTTAANGFFEYLPPGYGDGAPRPLLVYWHGIGENGNGTTELPSLLRNGPPGLVHTDSWPAERPFVVLSPQHSGGGCPSSSEIRDFIAFALDAYAVDPARVYLTGLSCGAIGSWNYLGENLDTQIVAMVPIAGDGRGAWSRSMCELGRVAIWAFHGDADDVVSPLGTTEPTTRLMDCPSPPRRDLRVTVYPGVGHNSWAETYDLSAGHDIYAWLLSQRR